MRSVKLSFLLVAFLIAASHLLNAQPADELLKEGLGLQQKYQDEAALEKYKQILLVNPANTEAGLRALEVTLALGQLAPLEKDRLFWLNQHQIYLDQFAADSLNDRYQYYLALYNIERAKQEKRPDRIAEWMKLAGLAAQKAVSINPSSGRANYALGKWHYEMLAFTTLKKAAIHLTRGAGLPDASLKTAIELMEFCRKAEPYFASNFLDLGKAHQMDERYETAIAVLHQLTRLPARRSTDAAAKVEGAKLLDSLK